MGRMLPDRSRMPRSPVLHPVSDPRQGCADGLSVPRLLSLSRVFAIAKGFRGKAKNCFRVANAQAEEALENQVVARSVSCVPRQSLLLSAGASGLTWWVCGSTRIERS